MPALSQYDNVLVNLIQSPTSPVPLLTQPLRTLYINIARKQIAAVGDMLPGYGTIQIGAGNLQYLFSAITFPSPPAPAGLNGAIAVETISWDTPSGGQQPLNAIDWARYNRYSLGHNVPRAGPPKVWTQFGQGSNGSFFVNLPDQAYTLSIRARCLPIDLVDDTTPDVIPYLWSDAVPFLAAWYCYMAMQRQADADHMLQRFQTLLNIARQTATPDTQPSEFMGGPDPFAAGRLGVASGPGRAAQPRQQNPPTAA